MPDDAMKETDRMRHAPEKPRARRSGKSTADDSESPNQTGHRMREGAIETPRRPTNIEEEREQD